MTWIRETRTQTQTTRASARGQRGGALARCLAPVSQDAFLASTWERAPLHVARAQPGAFDDLLSEADAERTISSGSLRHPAFRLVKEGRTFSEREYTVDIPWRPDGLTGMIDVERVLAEWQTGATIVLQALHHTWPPLSAFSRALEGDLGHPVQVNAYYTPRGSQGLAVHHDTHDVFVLQVAGAKRWLVYEPVFELPLKDQRYSPRMGAPGEAVLDVTLAAGDTLYLPRGWLHEALTSDADSLHLTVGVNVHTWLDALRAAVDACADDVDFRRAADEAAHADVAHELLARLADRLTPSAVAERRRARLVHRRRPLLDGQLSQLRALERLDAETPVERRPGMLSVAPLDGAVELAFAGKRIRLPARVRAEAEFLAHVEGPFTARALPGRLDDAGRLVLIRRLVRDGLLRIADESARLRASDGNASEARTS